MKAAAGGVAFGVGAAAFGNLSAYQLTLEKHDLALPKWEADGFKAAVVSDLHTNNSLSGRRAFEAIRMALAEKPDVLLLPGDFIDWSTIWPVKYLKEALSALEDAKCPVYAVMGNHDYGCARPDKIVEVFREHPKVQMLFNEAAEVSGVTIAGIDDALAGQNNPTFLLDPGQHSRSVLAMLHEPDFVTEVPQSVSLLVSGHSHGGQICLPGGVVLHTPRGAKKYRRGFYSDANVPLYVSRGVGTVANSLRFFASPEVTVLTLRGA